MGAHWIRQNICIQIKYICVWVNTLGDGLDMMPLARVWFAPTTHLLVVYILSFGSGKHFV